MSWTKACSEHLRISNGQRSSPTEVVMEGSCSPARNKEHRTMEYGRVRSGESRTMHFYFRRVLLLRLLLLLLLLLLFLLFLLPRDVLALDPYMFVQSCTRAPHVLALGSLELLRDDQNTWTSLDTSWVWPRMREYREGTKGLGQIRKPPQKKVGRPAGARPFFIYR